MLTRVIKITMPRHLNSFLSKLLDSRTVAGESNLDFILPRTAPLLHLRLKGSLVKWQLYQITLLYV